MEIKIQSYKTPNWYMVGINGTSHWHLETTKEGVKKRKENLAKLIKGSNWDKSKI